MRCENGQFAGDPTAVWGGFSRWAAAAVRFLVRKIELSAADAASLYLFFLPILLQQPDNLLRLLKRLQRGRSNKKQSHHRRAHQVVFHGIGNCR